MSNHRRFLSESQAYAQMTVAPLLIAKIGKFEWGLGTGNNKSQNESKQNNRNLFEMPQNTELQNGQAKTTRKRERVQRGQFSLLNNYLDSAISKETNKGYKVDRVKLKTNMRKYLPTNSSFSEVYGEKLMGYDKLNGLIDGGLITDRNTLEVKKDISRMEALSHGQSACLSNDNQTKRLKNCRGEKCTDNGGDRDSQKKKALRMQKLKYVSKLKDIFQGQQQRKRREKQTKDKEDKTMRTLENEFDSLREKSQELLYGEKFKLDEQNTPEYQKEWLELWMRNQKRGKR